MISPKKSWGYKGLGECLEKQGKISDARQLYETAIKKNPNKRFGYEYLYNLYKSQQRNGDIELVLLDALKIYPDEYDLLTLLGEYYSDVKDFSQAKAVLKKAVEINPDNLTAYELLGFVYGLEGNYGEMELVFEGALNKGQHVALDLVNWYIQRNDFERAEAFLNKLLQEKGPDELILRGLANVCERASNNNKADEIYLQIENLKHNIYGKNTKNNYNKLVRIIQSYGARVICMQYPLRGIEPLKRMLEENENILFIDNEKNFKGSLRQGRYEDFFEDSFAGDFGHCTALGNRLIAQNAARVIVEKVFSKN